MLSMYDPTNSVNSWSLQAGWMPFLWLHDPTNSVNSRSLQAGWIPFLSLSHPTNSVTALNHNSKQRRHRRKTTQRTCVSASTNSGWKVCCTLYPCPPMVATVPKKYVSYFKMHKKAYTPPYSHILIVYTANVCSTTVKIYNSKSLKTTHKTTKHSYRHNIQFAFKWLLKLYIPLNTKYIISETFFPANLFANTKGKERKGKNVFI